MTKIERKALRVAAVGAVLLLAGCGGSGATAGAGAASSGCGCGSSLAGPTAASDPSAYYYNVLSPGYDQQRQFLNGDLGTGAGALPNTTYAAMPTSGTATYSGYVLLYANADGAVAGTPALGMEGTSNLTADFDNSTMTGEASNFVGGTVKLDSAGTHYDFTEKPVHYTGSLTMTDGCIGVAAGCKNVTRPNQFSGTYAGKLTGEGNTLSTAASLLGDFRGTPVQGIYATAQSGTLTVNGTGVKGNMVVTGEP